MTTRINTDTPLHSCGVDYYYHYYYYSPCLSVPVACHKPSIDRVSHQILYSHENHSRTSLTSIPHPFYRFKNGRKILGRRSAASISAPFTCRRERGLPIPAAAAGRYDVRPQSKPVQRHVPRRAAGRLLSTTTTTIRAAPRVRLWRATSWAGLLSTPAAGRV